MKRSGRKLKEGWDFSCIPEVFGLVFFVSLIMYVAIQ